MQNLDDIPMKTTYSPEEIEEKKQKYLEFRALLVQQFDTLKQLVTEVGDEPVHGEQRKIFFEKFNTLDRGMINKFDRLSFDYFEAKENPEE